jgi:hypothetical protein
MTNKSLKEEQAQITKTTQAMNDSTKAILEYKAKLAQYKSMSPDQQAQNYNGIAQGYNKAAVAYNASSEQRYQGLVKSIFDYPLPNTSYISSAENQGLGSGQDTPEAEPAKNYKPPEILGEKPLEQLNTGLTNWLKGQKLDWLADTTDLFRKAAVGMYSTEKQALLVDTMRNIIGWSVEKNEQIRDPNKSTLEKAGAYGLAIGEGLLSPLTYGAKVGAMSVSLLQMRARMAGQQLGRAVSGDKNGAKSVEETMTARERYEVVNAMGGTIEPLVSGIVDAGKIIFQEWGQRTWKTIQQISGGTYKGFNAADEALSIATMFSKAYAQIAYNEANRPTLEAEFLRRYREGESASLLAIEYSDPIKEMVAQIIYDPFNLADFIINPIVKGMQAKKIAQLNDVTEMLRTTGRGSEAVDFEKALEAVRALKPGMKAGDEVADAFKLVGKYSDEFMPGSRRAIELAQMGKADVKIPFTGMFGKPAKTVEVGGALGRIISRTSTAHVDDYMMGIKSALSSVIGDMKNLDGVDQAARAGDMLWAWGRVGAGVGDDISTYNTALKVLADSPSAKHIFSQNGAKAANIFFELLYDESGKINPEKLAKLTSLVTDAAGKEGGVLQITKKLANMVGDIFPTVGRRMELEAKAVNIASDIAAGPSKRIVTLQNQLAKDEKVAAKLARELKGTMSDDEFLKLVKSWDDVPATAPKKAREMSALAQKIEDAKDVVAQSSKIPRNIQHWVDNPVSDIERLGWKVLEGKEAIYNKFMPALNRIYIQWNPGQWGRNFLTNEMHIMFDEGLTSATHLPQQCFDEAMKFADKGVLPANVLQSVSSMTGDAMSLFTGPISHQVEQLGHAQAALGSIRNTTRKMFNSASFQESFKILSDAGVSDDIVKAFKVECEHGLSAREAAEKILGGDALPRKIQYFLDQKQVDTLQKFGLHYSSNDLLKPQNVGDDTKWGKFFDDTEVAFEKGKSVLPSQVMDFDEDTSRIVDGMVARAADVQNETNPMLVMEANYYGAQHTQFTQAFGIADQEGNILLKGHDEQVMRDFGSLYRYGGGKKNLGLGAIEKSQDEASKAAQSLWSEYHKLKGNPGAMPYSQAREEANRIYRTAADAQYKIRLDTVNAMKKFLADKGVDVSLWEDRFATSWIKADDLFGDTVALRSWDTEKYYANGQKINFIGENGSPVLNAFASRGIPLNSDPASRWAATFDKTGRPYSWKSIQGQLRRQGINWDTAKIAGKDFTPEEFAQLEKAVDAIADSRKVSPVAGVGKAPVWKPSRDWQEAPEFMTGGELPKITVPAQTVKPGETAFGKVKQVSGAPIRGTAIPWDDPKIPDTVYHMTTNLSDVEKGGMLKARGAGGLGGDAKDAIVSMTIDKNVAEQLSNDMKFTRDLAERLGKAQPTANRSEWSNKLVEALQEQARKEGWEWSKPMGDPESYDFMDWVRSFYTKREWEKPELRNPVFMGSVEDMLKIDPKNIGVIEIPRANLNTGALITDFDLKSSTGLKEIRMYGDVPIKSRGTIDPFTYDTKIDNGKMLVRVKEDVSSQKLERLTNESIIDQLSRDPKNAKLREEMVQLKLADNAAAPVGGGETGWTEDVRSAKEAETAKRQKRLSEIKAELLRQHQRLPGTVAPHDTAPPIRAAQGLAQQETEVRKILTELREKAIADIGERTGKKFTPDQEKAFWKVVDQLDQKITDMKPIISQIAQADMDFTMLNYNDRRGFDVLLNFIMPYHFWYSRTYANWARRIAQNPGVVAAYAIYRKKLEEIHATLPDYYKYNLNTNELFGMDSDSPLYFNLEATFNPLNGLTGVDFNDPDKSQGWFANMVQQMGKLGPSIHTPILLMVGAAQLVTGNREAAESWLGRLIPQTATIKAITNLLGIDPQGVGGLELDPMVLAMGGMGKYEIRGVQRVISQFEADGKLPDGTPFAHEQAIDAQYSQSGPIWEMAANAYNRQRAPGRLMSSIGGPGFQSRPKTDIYIDQFYSDVNALYERKGLMDTEKWKQAMSALYKKYPYANGLLMARKSGVARDEALAYDVLNRIPPGQLNDFAKLVGVDSELIDAFYSGKGLVDDKGKPTMNEADMRNFTDGIRDLGAILAMPPTAVRAEWDAARQRYSQAFSVVPEETMRNVDTYYMQLSVSSEAGKAYLAKHPEVEQYMMFREKTISEDATLFRFYGSIDFVEKYYQRIMSAEALEKWPEIDKVAQAYSDVQKNGGDTKAFVKDHPELKEYWNYLDEERGKIKSTLAYLSGKVSETLPYWRKDMQDLSKRAEDTYKSRMSLLSDSEKTISSMALPYIGASQEQVSNDRAFNDFLTHESEKRWPGIFEIYKQYEQAKSQGAAAEQQFLYEHPEVVEYEKWKRNKTSDYNMATKVGLPPAEQAATWETSKANFGDSIQRLVEAYFRTGKLSSATRKSLERTLRAMGITDVDGWLSQMSKSMGA